MTKRMWSALWLLAVVLSQACVEPAESPPAVADSEPETADEAAEPDAEAVVVDGRSDAGVAREDAISEAGADAAPEGASNVKPDAARESMSDAALGSTSDGPLATPLDGSADAEVPCIPFVPPATCPDPGTEETPLPQELRCTGLYGDADSFTLACGVRPYTPAYALWSDGAQKHRYVSLPEGETIDVTDPEGFVFPVGTQLWKEFWVDVEGEAVRAETRLLRKTSLGWLYTTYVWSEDGTGATQENGGVPFIRGSSHSVPTRDQCRDCHKGREDFALGWDPILLGEGASGMTRGELVNQGLVGVRDDTGALGAVPQAWLEPAIPGGELEREALGYLHVNCGVSCHNDHTAAMARETGVYMRLDLDTLSGSASEVDAVVTAANRLPGLHAKLPPGGPYYDLLPGQPAHSLMLARMRVRGETQMPPLGSNVVDAVGSALVSDWIASMSADAGYPAPADVGGGASGGDVDAGEVDGMDGGRVDGSMDSGSADSGTDAGRIDAGMDAALPDGGLDAAPDAGVVCDAASAPDVSRLSYEVVVQSAALETLTFATQPPNSSDWYLVEMRGRILRLHEGVLDDTPFLDLTGAIELGAGFDQTTLTYDERGLVGLAFAPDYADSGLFYVTITPSRANTLGLPLNHDLVAEFVHDAQADPPVQLSRILLDVPSASGYLGNIHNANTVLFGPDGLLYVGMGDGGGVQCNNAEVNAAQDVGRVFGKLLRLDPSRPGLHGASGNPFTVDGDPRVLHYGLRNPFRFSFDRSTGDLYIGDVGQDRYEEIDFVPRGAGPYNFGWARYEANADCPSALRPLREDSEHTPPIFVADRTGNGPYRDYRAIVGGVVYRGSALPALRGVYLFGDYYGARLGALRRCGGATSPVAPLRKGCDPNFDEACLAAPAGSSEFESLTAIVEDHAGEVYFVANGDRLLKLTSAR